MPPDNESPSQAQPPESPPTPTPRPPHNPSRFRWDAIAKRARVGGSIASLFAMLIIIGGLTGYFLYATNHKTPATKSNQPQIQSLSQSELNQLSQVGSNLGSTGQTLSIGANALFRGSVTVGGDLSVTGRLSANGPATLSQLGVTGATALGSLTTSQGLTVAGVSTLQSGLSVKGLATIDGGLNVSGATSLNTLNVGSIAVHTISIAGPLTIGHLITEGPPPIVAGGADGAGGTVSISGNDTAGQVNINTGTGPGTTLATITFRATYGTSVHVQLSPITGPAAAAQAYVTRNNGGFQVHANTPPSGSVLSFDYLVTQ